MISSRITIIFAVVLAITGTVSAQQGFVAAPIEWRNYKVPTEKVTFKLPKFPVLMVENYGCDGFVRVNFATYAAGSVYRVTLVRPASPDSYCRRTRYFGFDLLQERVAELKSGPKKLVEMDDSTADIVHLKGEGGEMKIFKDSKGKRWFEFEVVRPTVEATTKAFLDSLVLKLEPDATDVGGGVATTVGDAVPGNKLIYPSMDVPLAEKVGSASQEVETKLDPDIVPMVLVVKPRASYTDAARQNDVEGSVVLRVTFLENGSIGPVKVDRGLPNGITEEAIKAVRQMVFIPTMKKGIPISVVKPVEFSFKIY